MMATSRPGTPREIITSAERRFPVRIRIAVPPAGLGQRYALITAWLDENCGYDGWAMTPSGTRGLLNDALSIYFGDATLASGTQAGRRKSLGDSPLEGTGFEPSVPLLRKALLGVPIGDGGTKGGATYRFRSETAMLAWSGCRRPFPSRRDRGTASSNLSSSSAESGTN
jgi:hypothetical protein